MNQELQVFIGMVLTAIDRSRSCSGKFAHRDENAATKAALSLNKKRGRNVEAYPCRYCDAWHIGSPRGKVTVTVTPNSP